MAGEYSCGARITWLMSNDGESEEAACHQVGANEFSGACGACAAASAPPSPPLPPLPPPLPSSSGKCGGAVNAGSYHCEPMLWGPTSDRSLPCYAYGGASDPCALTNTNDFNDGLDKDPSHCTQGDTFFLWDEPDTQGRSYAWAATAWLGYAQAHAAQIAALRARGVRVTTPLLKADQPGDYLEEFWAVCGDACHDPSSPAYIDIVAVNPFCGAWNEPIGTAEGCRGGAEFVVDQLRDYLRGRPIHVTNWGYLGGDTTEAQLAAMDATDAFFAADSPVERVYWFGARDYGGGTTRNFLSDVVESGERAGSTLGELWAERCSSL